MRYLPIFLASKVLADAGEDHSNHQADIIDAFLAETSGARAGHERVSSNCDQNDLANNVADSLWKCNGKGTRCKLLCQTAAKPPKTIYMCKKSESGIWGWTKKSGPDDLSDDLCQVTPPCGILDPVIDGVWNCNKQMTTCRLTCPDKYTEWADEGTRVLMKCRKNKAVWFPKGKNTEKKMNCQGHMMYDTEIIGAFTVHIEEGMDKYMVQKQGTSSWRATLTRDIERVTDALPGPALDILSDVRIYLHKKYMYPGETDSSGAAVYHPSPVWLGNNGNLREKARCIDLYDVFKYVNWRRDHQPLMLLHEFTHAYHHRILHSAIDWGYTWGNRIRERYEAAMDNDLYSDVYASTNDWEYLAEISEAFFSADNWYHEREPELKNDLYPYRIDQLKSYDPEGYEMLEDMWGVTDGGRDEDLEPHCWTVQDNPNKNKKGYKSFDRYIRVLDTFDIYAEPEFNDRYIRFAASVVAELLDNDEDGVIDDTELGNKLRNEKAVMPMFAEGDSDAEEDFWDNVDGGSAALYKFEVDPDETGSVNWDRGRDATVEEILHTINHIGHAALYPDVFGMDEDSNSLLTQAMDVARGGRFIDIPDKYPAKAWYGYDDDTCEYDCMATEYLYWGIVANMGILAPDCEWIKDEWRACLVDDFRRRDHRLHKLIEDYNLPKWAPNGNYRRSREC